MTDSVENPSFADPSTAGPMRKTFSVVSKPRNSIARAAMTRAAHFRTAPEGIEEAAEPGATARLVFMLGRHAMPPAIDTLPENSYNPDSIMIFGASVMTHSTPKSRRTAARAGELTVHAQTRRPAARTRATTGSVMSVS